MSIAPPRPCWRCRKIVDRLETSIVRERRMYEVTQKAYAAQVRNFQSTIANVVGYLRADGMKEGNPVMALLLGSLGAVEKVQENCDECGGIGECDIERGGTWVTCAVCDGTGVKPDEQEEEGEDASEGQGRPA